MTETVIRIDKRDMEDKLNKIEEELQSELLEGLREPALDAKRTMIESQPKYTGKLQGATDIEETGDLEITIGPWGIDYALDLIEGTSTIDATFSEIAAWADFRGLPAGPVWYKLITEGIDSAEQSPYREDYQESAYRRLNAIAQRDVAKHINKWIGGI